MRDEEAFRSFVQTNGPALLHTARLLTGDHHRAEDLVQATLTKIYLKWERLEQPLAYARRALVTAQIDSSRRRWWGERPTETLPESAAADPSTTLDDRDQLRRLLAGLNARERAVIVLRYYCDLSEQQTAEVLGVPVGTVKSSGSRALARLRVHAARDSGTTRDRQS